MVIDHLGIVVRSIKEGIIQWQRLFGYKQGSNVVTNTRQQVKVVFLSKPDSILVKLIEPTDEGSPIAAFARRGGGLHHLCFRCDDLGAQIPQLKEGGARLMVAPEPGEAFKNHNIAFLLAANLNIELIDTIEKDWMLPINRIVPGGS